MPMLKPSGRAGGKPEGSPVDKPDKRSLLRQIESADAIAWAAYRVVHGPMITQADIIAGIKPDKRPDYRIEGVLFDCYSPEPALVQLEQARLEVFHTQYTPTSEDDFDSGWERLPVYPGKSHAYTFQHEIDKVVGDKVLERIRIELTRKISEGQALGVVVNLTDVVEYVSTQMFQRMAIARGIKGLQYAFAVVPKGPPVRKDSKRGRIGRGSFINYGGGATTPYAPEYLYSEYEPQALEVTVILP